MIKFVDQLERGYVEKATSNSKGNGHKLLKWLMQNVNSLNAGGCLIPINKDGQCVERTVYVQRGCSMYREVGLLTEEIIQRG